MAGYLCKVQALALTFDDGPTREATPVLLDLLSAARATATFFPIAANAAAHPDLIERMQREGHSVGLHCYEHVRHSSRDLAWCRADTARALGLLAGLGVRPRLWRTPWGDVARWTSEVAQECGLRLIGWSADTNDWRGDAAATMFSRTKPDLLPGAIVLAHDGLGPGARRENVNETLAYAQLALEHAKREGTAVRALR